MKQAHSAKNIYLAGATGTIGRAVTSVLLKRGYNVTCLVRRQADISALPKGVKTHLCAIDEILSIDPKALENAHFDVVISCLASRTGVKADAWKIDFEANQKLLAFAGNADAKQFILLSAICVQKPTLNFQHAKLAFETELQKSDLNWTIIRPTAFFKSLSGQLDRVLRGKSFLVFGDGQLTRCKPISDDDLAEFIVAQIFNAESKNRILPIGGPGPAISPREQAHYIFKLLDKPPRIKHVPLIMMKMIVFVLTALSKLFPKLEEKAEYARIGYYYATQSMLVWNEKTQKYDADATPSYGTDTLFYHYKERIERHKIIQ